MSAVDLPIRQECARTLLTGELY